MKHNRNTVKTKTKTQISLRPNQVIIFHLNKNKILTFHVSSGFKYGRKFPGLQKWIINIHKGHV